MEQFSPNRHDQLLKEQIESVENSLNDVKNNCLDVQKFIDSTENEEVRNALIYELQRQRLRYARNHVEKIALLHAMEDESVEIVPSEMTPTWREPKWQATTAFATSSREENTTELPFQRGTIHRTSTCSVRVKRSSGRRPKSTTKSDGRDDGDAGGEGDEHDSAGTSKPESARKCSENFNERVEGEDIAKKLGKPQIRTTFKKKHLSPGSGTAHCDSTLSSHQFLIDELPEVILARGSDERAPFDHSEETDVATHVDEIVLLGDGAECGASANALVDRREKILNVRSATEREIRFVHEHTHTYRIETVLHLDDISLLEWAQNVLAQKKNYGKSIIQKTKIRPHKEVKSDDGGFSSEFRIVRRRKPIGIEAEKDMDRNQESQLWETSNLNYKSRYENEHRDFLRKNMEKRVESSPREINLESRIREIDLEQRRLNDEIDMGLKVSGIKRAQEEEDLNSDTVMRNTETTSPSGEFLEELGSRTLSPPSEFDASRSELTSWLETETPCNTPDLPETGEFLTKTQPHDADDVLILRYTDELPSLPLEYSKSDNYYLQSRDIDYNLSINTVEEQKQPQKSTRDMSEPDANMNADKEANGKEDKIKTVDEQKSTQDNTFGAVTRNRPLLDKIEHILDDQVEEPGDEEIDVLEIVENAPEIMVEEDEMDTFESQIQHDYDKLRPARELHQIPMTIDHENEARSWSQYKGSTQKYSNRIEENSSSSSGRSRNGSSEEEEDTVAERVINDFSTMKSTNEGYSEFVHRPGHMGGAHIESESEDHKYKSEAEYGSHQTTTTTTTKMTTENDEGLTTNKGISQATGTITTEDDKQNTKNDANLMAENTTLFTAGSGELESPLKEIVEAQTLTKNRPLLDKIERILDSQKGTEGEDDLDILEVIENAPEDIVPEDVRDTLEYRAHEIITKPLINESKKVISAWKSRGDEARLSDDDGSDSSKNSAVANDEKGSEGKSRNEAEDEKDVIGAIVRDYDLEKVRNIFEKAERIRTENEEPRRASMEYEEIDKDYSVGRLKTVFEKEDQAHDSGARVEDVIRDYNAERYGKAEEERTVIKESFHKIISDYNLDKIKEEFKNMNVAQGSERSRHPADKCGQRIRLDEEIPLQKYSFDEKRNVFEKDEGKNKQYQENSSGRNTSEVAGTQTANTVKALNTVKKLRNIFEKSEEALPRNMNRGRSASLKRFGPSGGESIEESEDDPLFEELKSMFESAKTRQAMRQRAKGARGQSESSDVEYGPSQRRGARIRAVEPRMRRSESLPIQGCYDVIDNIQPDENDRSEKKAAVRSLAEDIEEEFNLLKCPDEFEPSRIDLTSSVNTITSAVEIVSAPVNEQNVKYKESSKIADETKSINQEVGNVSVEKLSHTQVGQAGIENELLRTREFDEQNQNVETKYKTRTKMEHKQSFTKNNIKLQTASEQFTSQAEVTGQNLTVPIYLNPSDSEEEIPVQKHLEERSSLEEEAISRRYGRVATVVEAQGIINLEIEGLEIKDRSKSEQSATDDEKYMERVRGSSYYSSGGIVYEELPGKYTRIHATDALPPIQILAREFEAEYIPLSEEQHYGSQRIRKHRSSHRLSILDLQDLASAKTQSPASSVLSLTRSDDLLRIPMKPPRKYSENFDANAQPQAYREADHGRSQSLMDSIEMEMRQMKGQMQYEHNISGLAPGQASQFDKNFIVKDELKKYTLQKELIADLSSIHDASISEWQVIEAEASKILDSIQQLSDLQIGHKCKTLVNVLARTRDMPHTPLNVVQRECVERILKRQPHTRRRQRLAKRRKGLECREFYDDSVTVVDQDQMLTKDPELKKVPLVVEREEIQEDQCDEFEITAISALRPSQIDRHSFDSDKNETLKKFHAEVSELKLLDSALDREIGIPRFADGGEEITESGMAHHSSENKESRLQSNFEMIEEKFDAILPIQEYKSEESELVECEIEDLPAQPIVAFHETHGLTRYHEVQEEREDYVVQPIPRLFKKPINEDVVQREDWTEFLDTNVHDDYHPSDHDEWDDKEDSLQGEYNVQEGETLNRNLEIEVAKTQHEMVHGTDSAEAELTNPYWIETNKSFDAYLEPEAHVRKTSMISLHSLSSIMEEEEEEEREERAMREEAQLRRFDASEERDQADERDHGQGDRKKVAFSEVIILHWIEPEAEMESVELDRSKFSVTVKQMLNFDFCEEEEWEVRTRKIEEEKKKEMEIKGSQVYMDEEKASLQKKKTDADKREFLRKSTTKKEYSERNDIEVSKNITKESIESLNEKGEKIFREENKILTHFPSLSSSSTFSQETFLDYEDENEHLIPSPELDQGQEIIIKNSAESFSGVARLESTSVQWGTWQSETHGDPFQRTVEEATREIEMTEEAEHVTAYKSDIGVRVDQTMIQLAKFAQTEERLESCLYTNTSTQHEAEFEVLPRYEETQYALSESVYRADRSIGVNEAPIYAESAAQTIAPISASALLFASQQRNNKTTMNTDGMLSVDQQQLAQNSIESQTEEKFNLHNKSCQVDDSAGSSSTDARYANVENLELDSRKSPQFSMKKVNLINREIQTDPTFLTKFGTPDGTKSKRRESLEGREEVRRIFDEILEIRKIVDAPLYSNLEGVDEARPRTSVGMQVGQDVENSPQQLEMFSPSSVGVMPFAFVAAKKLAFKNEKVDESLAKRKELFDKRNVLELAKKQKLNEAVVFEEKNHILRKSKDELSENKEISKEEKLEGKEEQTEKKEHAESKEERSKSQTDEIEVLNRSCQIEQQLPLQLCEPVVVSTDEAVGTDELTTVQTTNDHNEQATDDSAAVLAKLWNDNEKFEADVWSSSKMLRDCHWAIPRFYHDAYACELCRADVIKRNISNDVTYKLDNDNHNEKIRNNSEHIVDLIDQTAALKNEKVDESLAERKELFDKRNIYELAKQHQLNEVVVSKERNHILAKSKDELRENKEVSKEESLEGKDIKSQTDEIKEVVLNRSCQTEQLLPLQLYEAVAVGKDAAVGIDELTTVQTTTDHNEQATDDSAAVLAVGKKLWNDNEKFEADVWPSSKMLRDCHWAIFRFYHDVYACELCRADVIKRNISNDVTYKLDNDDHNEKIRNNSEHTVDLIDQTAALKNEKLDERLSERKELFDKRNAFQLAKNEVVVSKERNHILAKSKDELRENKEVSKEESLEGKDSKSQTDEIKEVVLNRSCQTEQLLPLQLYEAVAVGKDAAVGIDELTTVQTTTDHNEQATDDSAAVLAVGKKLWNDNEKFEADVWPSSKMLRDCHWAIPRFYHDVYACELCRADVIKRNISNDVTYKLDNDNHNEKIRNNSEHIVDLIAVDQTAFDISATKRVERKMELPQFLRRRPSLPAIYSAPSPAEIGAADLDALRFLSSCSVSAHLFHRFLLNVNATGNGPHTWHIPYFLVPKEPEFLPLRTGVHNGSERASKFLPTVAAFLMRKTALEDEMRARRTRVKVHAVEEEWTLRERQKVEEMAKNFDKLSVPAISDVKEQRKPRIDIAKVAQTRADKISAISNAENENQIAESGMGIDNKQKKVRPKADYIKYIIVRHSDEVVPLIVPDEKEPIAGETKLIQSTDCSKPKNPKHFEKRPTIQRKGEKVEPSAEFEAAIAKELADALRKRFQRLEAIEAEETLAKAESNRIEIPPKSKKFDEKLSMFGGRKQFEEISRGKNNFRAEEKEVICRKTEKLLPLESFQFAKEKSDCGPRGKYTSSNDGSAAVQATADQPAAVHPTDAATAAVVGGEQSSSSSESDKSRDYCYIRSAKSLFRRLDRDYRKRLERRGKQPLRFTVRFVKPNTISLVGTRNYRRTFLPELIDAISASSATMENGTGNGSTSIDDTMQLNGAESDATRSWDATNLLNRLYHVDYNPLAEKRSRFRNMEGHLEVPNDEPNLIPDIDKQWKKLYFRTKDGRFQWFATHFADEHPIEDILLTGTTVTANRNDWTITIKGGKEAANLTVKTPSNLFEKWIQALMSHSQSALIDAYVQPVYPPVPHYTQKVVLIELGSCSVRAGLLTNRPSLPQVFFPAVGCVLDSGKVAVGVEAFRPEVRQYGQLQSPIQASDLGEIVERYKLNKPILGACLQKVINELNVDTTKHKVLVSIPQNIPTVHASDLLRLLVKELRFKAASIARQPSLILYSYDVTTGIVVDIGERLNIVPVIDEYIVESAIISLPFGAPQIRKSLQKELAARNQRIRPFNTAIEQILLRHIAEQSCYVAVDFEEENKNKSKDAKHIDFEKYKIGGGVESEFTVFEVDAESAFSATEGLFKPKRWGVEMKGIHHLVHDAIQQSPIDSRRTLYRNIYLCGGTALLPGVCERLETELSKIAPSSIFVQVHGSPWRYHAAYLGSQVIANSFQFENCCAEAKNLDEYIRQMESTA